MSKIFFLVLSLISLNVLSGNKVIGGTRTTNLEHPWQVSLQVKFSGHLCGASLIRKNIVLTAAHCVKSFTASDLRLKGRSTTGEVKKLKRMPRIKSIHMHPDFNPDNIVAHDIAVIVLRSDVRTNDYINVIDIPSQSDSFIMESDFRDLKGRFSSTGWGATATPGRFPIYSKNLLEVDVAAVGVTKVDLVKKDFRDEMIRKFNMDDELLNYIQGNNSNVLLTTGVAPETGNCLGDSGGPLVYYDETSKPTLVGVTSYAAGGKELCKGIVGFTNIQAYTQWINKYL